MDKNSLLQVLADVAGTEEVRRNPELQLFETQTLDSMRVVELIVEVEEKFGIVISPAEFDRECWETSARFVQDMEARLAARA